MAEDRMKGLKSNYKKRTEEARRLAQEAIIELVSEEKKVNFNSVHNRSGISKSFLYEDDETRKRIEEQRAHDVDREMNRRARYEKTSQSKDVIIEAKDKRIARLEAENKKLRAEVEHLRGLLYAGQ
ncbi:MAG: DUF6262 family protein [Lachnospiraceae bacterium]|nr:DUF6262 family protein [Lachnospiraceae bacterium]